MAEDAVYLGMRNEVSFIIVDALNLWEHQSTYNPNMPMRRSAACEPLNEYAWLVETIRGHQRSMRNLEAASELISRVQSRSEWKYRFYLLQLGLFVH